MQDKFDALRAANVARCPAAFFPLEHWGPMQWGCALGGEIGEAQDALFAYDRARHFPGRGASEAEKAVLELADVVAYADLTLARLGITMTETFADFSHAEGFLRMTVLNILKKIERDGQGSGHFAALVSYMRELVRTCFLIATHLGWDLWEAIALKFNRVSEVRGSSIRLSFA